MGEASTLEKLMTNFRSTCKYYTGYPKDLGPSRVVHFTSERELMKLLDQGHPVVVAYTIRGNYTKHLDKVLEEAAVEFHPHIKFIRVECPKFPGFCLAQQQRKREREKEQAKQREKEARERGEVPQIEPEKKDFEYPFIEVYRSAEVARQERVRDPNIRKYSVNYLPFNYDVSPYGFREFFKRYGVQSSAGPAQ